MDDGQTWQRVLKIISHYDQSFVIVSATARTTRHLLSAAKMAPNDLKEARRIAQEIKTRHHQIVTYFKNNFPDAETKRIKECNIWIDERISALNDHLTEIHHIHELSPSKEDAVASIGEQLSSYLFAQCGKIAGFSTRWIDASEIIRTNSDFGQATPNTQYINQKIAELLKILEPKEIPIMGGFYSQDSDGNTTTLGFEGSDYSASLIGAAVSADSIEIWTDVSGIYTCDPRYISDAQPIPQLSFQEATELAYFGAKVLHPSTTKPASAKQIPVQVKNIFEPDAPGTRISHEQTHTGGRAKAITFKEDAVVITVTSSNTVMGYEFLSGVFDILSWHHLPVDVVTTTEASVSIAIENGDQIENAVEQLQKFGSVELISGQGIISLVGCTQDDTRSLVNNVLKNIDDSSVNLISFSQSKGNLNIVMNEKFVLSSVKSVHQSIFE